MKRSLLIALCLLSFAGLAFGQAGSVGIFRTATSPTDCNLTEAGLCRLYYWHVNVPCASACEFRVEVPAYWDNLGDIWMFDAIIGSSTAGVSIGYGTNLAGPIYLGRSTFEALDVTPDCTLVGIVGLYTTGAIAMVDCGTPPVKHTATGGSAVVNNDGTCPCDVPVEDTTWGGVKALYR